MKSEQAVLGALAARYKAPEYAFMQHVRNGTGFTRRVTRTADALAFSLWPSRGLELHGFEVKVSRGDWARELKDPSKAEEIMGFCHRWWIAVGDADIVRPGELPPTWGLLVPRGEKQLVVKVEAPLREAKPLDPPMIAAILRKATENVVPQAAVNDLVNERVEKEVAHRLGKTEEEHLRRQLGNLQGVVDRFQERSGIVISAYDGPAIAEACRLVARSQHAVSDARTALELPAWALKQALKQLSALCEEIDKQSAQAAEPT